jgi:hypothetical protein
MALLTAVEFASLLLTPYVHDLRTPGLRVCCCIHLGVLLPSSLDVRFSYAADNADSQCPQAFRVICSDHLDWWQQRIVRADVCSIFGGLLNGFHFFLASGVVKGTDDDGLSEEDVSRG